MKKVNDYPSIYLKSAILLNRWLEIYESVPVLSWDKMLSKTKVKLGLISDVGMYLVLEKGMRYL